VVEGWHGVSYGKPLQRTREYIEIVRAILAREVPVEHHGKEFDIPYTGPGASGLGKPLKSILHGRKDMPIYTASISPKGIALAGEIADGVIPVWMNPERWDIYDAPLKEGFAKSGGKKSLDNFDVAPFVQCYMGPDVEKCRMPVKGMLALYIGGMGARSKNFYNDYVKRMGYEDVAGKIQDLFLAGKKAEAMALVPNKLVDEVALVGNRERIADRLKAWKASPVKTMLIGTGDINTVRALAEICL
jgi:F420-dependent oxidoreductase-like protein